MLPVQVTFKNPWKHTSNHNRNRTVALHPKLRRKLRAGASPWHQHPCGVPEDMLAYSGSNMLCIKTGSFPPHMQKLQGAAWASVHQKMVGLNHGKSYMAVDEAVNNQVYGLQWLMKVSYMVVS